MLGPIRTGARRLAKPVNMNIMQKANNNQPSHVYGPPKNRMSWNEKLAHMTFITVGILGPTFYLVCNFKNYLPEEK